MVFLFGVVVDPEWDFRGTVIQDIPVPMAGAPGVGARQNSCRAPPTRSALPSSSVDKQHTSSIHLLLYLFVVIT